MCRTKYIFSSTRIKREALLYPEILPCLIEFCRKKLIWTPYDRQIATYYLVRHMRGTASELGLNYHQQKAEIKTLICLERKNCKF